MENCACSHSQRLTNRTRKPRLHSGQSALLRCSQGGLSFNRPKWRHESHLLNQRAGEKMSALRSLTFTTIPKLVANPTLDRRSNIIARLEEQKLLLDDPKYVRNVRTW